MMFGDTFVRLNVGNFFTVLFAFWEKVGKERTLAF